MTSSLLHTIESVDLRYVIGGAGATPIAAPKVPVPAMGGPKYSAAWWDLFRRAGLDK